MTPIQNERGLSGGTWSIDFPTHLPHLPLLYMLKTEEFSSVGKASVDGAVLWFAMYCWFGASAEM